MIKDSVSPATAEKFFAADTRRLQDKLGAEAAAWDQLAKDIAQRIIGTRSGARDALESIAGNLLNGQAWVGEAADEFKIQVQAVIDYGLRAIAVCSSSVWNSLPSSANSPEATASRSDVSGILIQIQAALNSAQFDYANLQTDTVKWAVNTVNAPGQTSPQPQPANSMSGNTVWKANVPRLSPVPGSALDSSAPMPTMTITAYSASGHGGGIEAVYQDPKYNDALTTGGTARTTGNSSNGVRDALIHAAKTVPFNTYAARLVGDSTHPTTGIIPVLGTTYEGCATELQSTATIDASRLPKLGATGSNPPGTQTGGTPTVPPTTPVKAPTYTNGSTPAKTPATSGANGANTPSTTSGTAGKVPATSSASGYTPTSASTSGYTPASYTPTSYTPTTGGSSYTPPDTASLASYTPPNLSGGGMGGLGAAGLDGGGALGAASGIGGGDLTGAAGGLGADGAGGVGGAGPAAGAAAGRSGMPMSPMAGAGGGKENKNRNRTSYLPEDEDVWGAGGGDDLTGVL